MCSWTCAAAPRVFTHFALAYIVLCSLRCPSEASGPPWRDSALNGSCSCLWSWTSLVRPWQMPRELDHRPILMHSVYHPTSSFPPDNRVVCKGARVPNVRVWALWLTWRLAGIRRPHRVPCAYASRGFDCTKLLLHTNIKSEEMGHRSARCVPLHNFQTRSNDRGRRSYGLRLLVSTS